MILDEIYEILADNFDKITHEEISIYFNRTEIILEIDNEKYVITKEI